MPFAVTHILVPILLVALFRDIYLKNKKHFPLHYVLIAGFGGVLPDIDIPISYLLNILGVENWNIHHTAMHSLMIPIICAALFLILKPVHAHARICNLTRHNLKLSVIFLMLAIGTLCHISLDALFGEVAFFFFPFSTVPFGANLISFLPTELQTSALALLDGILLVIWIVYLELKHKISDFI